eukprot:3280610-Pyramimonas_sp.AAC.1
MVAHEPLVLIPTNAKRMEGKIQAVAKAKISSVALTEILESARAGETAGSPRPPQVIQLRDSGSTLAAQPSVLEE